MVASFAWYPEDASARVAVTVFASCQGLPSVTFAYSITPGTSVFGEYHEKFLFVSSAPGAKEIYDAS